MVKRGKDDGKRVLHAPPCPALSCCAVTCHPARDLEVEEDEAGRARAGLDSRRAAHLWCCGALRTLVR